MTSEAYAHILIATYLIICISYHIHIKITFIYLSQIVTFSNWLFTDHYHTT